MNKKNELRARGILNDTDLCQVAGCIITAIRSPSASRSGGTYWAGVVYGVANGRTWTVKGKLHAFASGSGKTQCYDRMKSAVKDVESWERSPFSPDSWFPTGTIEKALQLPIQKENTHE